jgi:tRNA U34 5-methylaminomethyl-2-thiouridine-forming methyltransferase MnmC
MHRELLITNDGSHTLTIPSMGITYHSHHGAIQESTHVYIKAGLDHYLPKNKTSEALSVFELGFGTGLNALLTMIRAEELQQKIVYEAIELFPIENEIVESLNYCKVLDRRDLEPVFLLLHNSDWEKEIEITPYFTLKKIRKSLKDFDQGNNYHLVYFDAFSPDEQPELWTAAIFSQVFTMMKEGGIFVTYCSKSEVRRNLTSVGFDVKKIPGPRGKREMIFATKPYR